MIDLKETVSTIEQHLDTGTPRSLTYAALECRLAIERICYERLRVMHEYISHDEIRRWQPAHVIKILAEEVDPHVSETYTISISSTPVSETSQPESAEDYNTFDFLPVGTHVGFKAGYLQKLWNALSNVALHARLPGSKSDRVTQFGDPNAIRKQVEAALTEIRRVSTGTLISTGIGREVKFNCVCGMLNKRRIARLNHGKIINCINPDCPETWEVEFDGDEIEFGRMGQEIECLCGKGHWVVRSELDKLPKRSHGTITCDCGAKIFVRWSLQYARQTSGTQTNDGFRDRCEPGGTTATAARSMRNRAVPRGASSHYYPGIAEMKGDDDVLCCFGRVAALSGDLHH